MVSRLLICLNQLNDQSGIVFFLLVKDSYVSHSSVCLRTLGPSLTQTQERVSWGASVTSAICQSLASQTSRSSQGGDKEEDKGTTGC